MYVNITQPFSHKLVIFNKLNDLYIICNGCHGKVLEERKYFSSIFNVTACEFSDYKWVANYMAIN